MNDEKCDLLSVVIIVYVLLCGYPPFNGENNRGIRAAVLRGRYCSHSEDWPGTGRKAKDIVHRLLRRDPRKRVTAEHALSHP
mmetsp:Transcript_8271/g.17869  ORF Transcript_8271/g.17869 Transcript_8271/m.17869 type:complete len:82 (-) Transcript_8271:406-651(-)